MTLNVSWGQTPAYKMLKPIWDSIDKPEGTALWDTPEWQAQPEIVQILDCIMRQEGFIGTPMSSVLMVVGMWDITEDNVQEVYGRMRTHETFTESTMLNGVGLYDEHTGEYTKPETPHSGYPMSPWMLSQFIGYSANWGRESRTQWVRRMRKNYDEYGKYTPKHVNNTIDMYAEAYTKWDSEHNDPTQNEIDAYLNA